MNIIPNTIGHLSNVIGYIYDNKNYIFTNKKYNFNKSYVLVSYNIINNYGYHNESLLQIISFIKNVNINEFNQLTYEIDNKKEFIPKSFLKIKYSKELYIKDSCNLCTFIKERYNLENIYDYPQLIVEYTEEEPEHISKLFHQLFINREISKVNIQEMNNLKNQITELEKELHKIKNEENKNILDEYMKKEEFMKSKL